MKPNHYFDFDSYMKDTIKVYGLNLYYTDEIYAPAEDTDLLVSYLGEWCGSIVKNPRSEPLQILEMGCGSGAAGLSVAKFLSQLSIPYHLTGLDINPEAVKISGINAQLNNLDKGCLFFLSNLYDYFLSQTLKDHFDLIIFNPPYLPSEGAVIGEKNRQMIDASWEGGERGHELTAKFLSESANFLHNGADLIFIGSSAVNQTPLTSMLVSLGMQVVEKRKIHFFFEDILLYHCQKIIYS